jgi:hypothetical protein
VGAKHPQPRRPVVEHPRQDQPDGLRSDLMSRAAEKRVDGRAVAVLFRPGVEPHDIVFDEEMASRRGHVDAARCRRGAVLGVLGLERSGPAEDRRQDARSRRRDVEHDEDRGGKVIGQVVDEPGERFDAPG